MLLFILLCHALFTPGIYCNKTTPNYPKNIKNSTSVDREAFTAGNFTEGGPIVQNDSTTLSRSNHEYQDTVLMSLEKDKTEQQVSRSKARKGAFYHMENSTEVTNTISEVHVTQKGKEETQELPPLHLTTIISNATQGNTEINQTLSKLPTMEDVHKTTPRPKKPTILSSDPLDKIIHGSNSITSIPSKKSEVVQMTSTTNNSPGKQKEPMSASRHPGMVMPLVITILVVPMFAVLGYMALRRGQEAWKNRHYKRMDFLLDGMYNE